MKPGHGIGGGQRFTDEDEQACQLAPEGKPMEGWWLGAIAVLAVAVLTALAAYQLAQMLFGVGAVLKRLSS